jgi:hypothetical protein
MQEAIIKTVNAAVQAFGLKVLPGSDGEVNVKEDVQQIAKHYNVKECADSIQFTATFSATFDPEKQRKEIQNFVDAEIIMPSEETA